MGNILIVIMSENHVASQFMYLPISQGVGEEIEPDDFTLLIEEILELVSKELNHFGVIAGLFRQIGGHGIRFVLFCSF